MIANVLMLAAAAVSIAGSVSAQRVQDVQSDRGMTANLLSKRQPSDDDFEYDEDSICYSYGIDFQNGGSYFIDSRITENFTIVSQFENCVPDTSAYVLLVNNESGDQLECTGVPTTPDLTNQMSTCPIKKSEMTSGSWSILVIGNNGDGSPFGWQRDFTLTVGVPTTSTTTSTVTYTEITTPVTTIQTTSTMETTTSVPNESTVTIPAATRTITITPKAQTITSTKWLTRTRNSWTKSQLKITKTVVPTCTVPPRPDEHDPKCTILPTIIPLPTGLTISASKAKRMDSAIAIAHLRKRIESSNALQARLAREAELAKRSPDAPTVYVQAPIVINATTTSTAPVSTVSEVLLTTSTATITDPPQTVKSGTATVRTTLPAQTKTVTKIAYTTITSTRTMAVTWTYTTTIKPSASVSACNEQGGHFDLL